MRTKGQKFGIKTNKTLRRVNEHQKMIEIDALVKDTLLEQQDI